MSNEPTNLTETLRDFQESDFMGFAGAVRHGEEMPMLAHAEVFPRSLYVTAVYHKEGAGLYFTDDEGDDVATYGVNLDVGDDRWYGSIRQLAAFLNPLFDAAVQDVRKNYNLGAALGRLHRLLSAVGYKECSPR